MTDGVLPSAYLQKAQRALTGARLLLQAGDAEGACNRAYYAMFNAAHAALIAVGAESPGALIKTHTGLIAGFGQHLVRSHHLPTEYGANFNQVQRLRQLADYTGEPISAADATWALERAQQFVDIIAEKFHG
ncbi:MAG TPA: HEPN domain-containing protein [Xanthobacteraceae bacterium]